MKLIILVVTLICSSYVFAKIDKSVNDARNDFVRYLVKAELYEGVTGTSLRLKSCDSLQTISGDGDNKNFYIEFSTEKIKGEEQTVAQAYKMSKSGDKMYCKDILKIPAVPSKGATRTPQEICQHLGCALTHYSSPGVYSEKGQEKLKANCPSYSNTLLESERFSALQQELENVADLCSDPAFNTGAVNVSDRDYGKLPEQGGGANSNPGTSTHKQ